MSPPADGTSARRHGFDGDARRQQPHAGHLLREAVAGSRVDARHVGARSSHVEADDLRDAHPPRCIGRADGSASRSAEQHVLGSDFISGLQATGTRHDEHVRGNEADGI